MRRDFFGVLSIRQRGLAV